MSKKKSQDFNSSPFKFLKGLSLQKKQEVNKTLPPLPASTAIRNYDFTEEMKSLGVTVLQHDAEVNPSDSLVFDILPSVPPVATEHLNDAELFLQALQGMEVVFTEEFPDLEIPSSSPRRKKLVEQGRLRPSERLDLHGFTRSEARLRVAHFIKNAIHHGYPLVLVITGWGKHGSGEAILREEIMRFLRTDGAILVKEWSLAPPNLGGDGALLVFPRIIQKAR